MNSSTKAFQVWKKARWLETAFGLKQGRSHGERCVPKNADCSVRLPVRPATVSSKTLSQVTALTLYERNRRKIESLMVTSKKCLPLRQNVMLYDHVRTDFGLKALSGVSINWRTKDNRPPKDVPACGFRGDLAVCTPVDVSGKLDRNKSKNKNKRKSRHGNP